MLLLHSSKTRKSGFEEYHNVAEKLTFDLLDLKHCKINDPKNLISPSLHLCHIWRIKYQNASSLKVFLRYQEKTQNLHAQSGSGLEVYILFQEFP